MACPWCIGRLHPRQVSVNPYTILGALAIGAALFLGGMSLQFKLDEGEQAQKEKERQEVALKATNEARDKERKHAQDMEDAKADHAAKLARQKADHDKRVAALANQRLRVPVTSCSPAPEAGTSPGGSPGTATADVQPAFVERILSIGREADEVVLQLQLCQKIVTSDRQ